MGGFSSLLRIFPRNPEKSAYHLTCRPIIKIHFGSQVCQLIFRKQLKNAL